MKKLLLTLLLFPVLALGDTQDGWNGNSPPRNKTVVGQVVSVVDAEWRLIITHFKCIKGNKKPYVEKSTIRYRNGKVRDVTSIQRVHLKKDHGFMLKLNGRICGGAKK